jgi:transposase
LGSEVVWIFTELSAILFMPTSFAHLFSHTGQPAEAAWRLALITVMQFVEGLSDRQAADAVQGRIDFKYALGLELTDPGFDRTVLSEFRARLVAGNAEHLLLDTMLALFKERGWRHPRAASNGRIRRMCWPRSAHSIGSCAWEKRCTMH